MYDLANLKLNEKVIRENVREKNFRMSNGRDKERRGRRGKF